MGFRHLSLASNRLKPSQGLKQNDSADNWTPGRASNRLKPSQGLKLRIFAKSVSEKIASNRLKPSQGLKQDTTKLASILILPQTG